MASFEERRAEYLEAARHAAWMLFWRFQAPVTVDDVRHVCPPPEDIDPRVMGAVFVNWIPVGWTNSRRRTCHGRPIRRFRPFPEPSPEEDR
jgi:hypothetical protein